MSATSGEPDCSHAFARAAAGAVYDRLGGPAVEAARMSILDTLGVAMAAGGVEPAVRTVVDQVCHEGGRPDAAVWGRSARVPASAAAFANGAMAHGLDFDDQTPWGQHASSSVVPAALAVAEQHGGVSGRELLTAVAVGQDLFARLRCHVSWRKDWNLSSVLGVYAGSLAATRAVGASSEVAQAALSIASQQSAGVMQVVAGTGSDLRGIYAGFSARGAVTSASLAARGLSGVDALFEGPVGVLASYFADGHDRTAMLAGLGEEYRGAGTLYKLWPAVGTSHSHIHAIIALMAEHRLAVDDLIEIRVAVGDYHALMCTPLSQRQAPETLVDAKFSLPFLVALAAVHASVRVEHFTEAGIRDPRVHAVAARVVPVVDTSLDWVLELPPGRVEVTTRDGRVLSRVGADHPGSATRPVTWSELTDKFRSCVARSAEPPPTEAVEAIVAAVSDLEALDDVGDLTRLLDSPSTTRQKRDHD